MKELGITKEDLIKKFANRIDNDQGYDNLGLAKDLVGIVEKYTDTSSSELLERYNEAIGVLSEFMKYHESDFFKLIADDGRVKSSWILKAEQTISKANRE